MYELVDKENVLAALNSGAVMYCVDIPTSRIMECSNLTLSSIKAMLEKPETMFFKAV